MTGRVLLALAPLPLAECYTIHYEHRAAAEAGAPRESWHHGLVSGVLDLSGPLQLRVICPGGVASVERQVTFRERDAADHHLHPGHVHGRSPARCAGTRPSR